MPSKSQPASSKRASLPRAVDFSKAFAKDWKRLEHSGRYDMRKLKEAMTLLINNNAPLGSEWLDHALRGEWDVHRECHVGGDFLLIYSLADQSPSGVVVFVRAGTHSELF